MPSRYRVIVAPSVISELVEIGKFVREESPQAAAELVETVEVAFASLERIPLRGAMISENNLWGGEYRQLIRGPYRIIYKVAGLEVRVLKVIHGSRLLKIEPGDTI